MQRIRTIGTKFWHELRSNRRLQLGLLAVALIALLEGSLRWADRLEAEHKKLQQLRGELATLRAQSQNEAALRQTLAEFELARRQAETKLWNVSSEAVGQARLKEWLNNLIERAGALKPTLNLSAARPLGGKEGSTTAAPLAGKEEALREFRATLRYTFTPESLEKILAEIEAGETFSSVETLTVNRRERRVELTVRVLMRIGAPPTPPAPVASPTPVAPAKPAVPPALVPPAKTGGH